MAALQPGVAVGQPFHVAPTKRYCHLSSKLDLAQHRSELHLILISHHPL